MFSYFYYARGPVCEDWPFMLFVGERDSGTSMSAVSRLIEH